MTKLLLAIAVLCLAPLLYIYSFPSDPLFGATTAHTEAVGTFTDTRRGTTIEIESVQSIPTGVAVYARVWKDGQQRGFGKDATVDLERFVFYGTPTHVPDGTFTQVWDPVLERMTEQPNYREDPKAAIEILVSRAVNNFSKPSDSIIPGKRGNTVSCFYPDSTETTSMDSYLEKSGTYTSWALIHDAATADATDLNGSQTTLRVRATVTTDNWDRMFRNIYLFDTSAITDTDTIDSATLTLVGSGVTIDSDGSGAVSLTSSAPASDTSVASGDYDSFGTTAFATAINISSWSTSADNTFTFNSSGLAAITTTGVSKFGTLIKKDLDNNSTWSSALDYVVQNQTAEDGGASTTNDPELCVTHSAAAVVTSQPNLRINNSTLNVNSGNLYVR